MKLLIDAGNSRIKWGWLEQGRIVRLGGCAYAEQNCPQLPWQDAPSSPDAVYLASVASDAVNERIVESVRQHWSVPLHRLYSEERCCGVRNGYREPQQLGVDRWAAMIAARSHYPDALCIVDCGSAVTVDLLDTTGQHLGGYIVPGMGMQRGMLELGTAAVHGGEGKASLDWGNVTAACVGNGVAASLAALICSSARRLEAQTGTEVRTLLTGGDGAHILPLLECTAELNENLVLQGIALMAGEHKD